MDFTSKFNMIMQFTLREQIMLLILFVWSLAWKGMALWKSARRENKYWFVALLVINTVGILEILYIYIFSKKESKEITDNKI